MTTRKMLIPATVLPILLFFSAAAGASSGCVTCTVAQECEPGHNGAYCAIYNIDGDMWCNWVDPCETAMLNPLDISPAGTFVSNETVRSASNDLLVSACGGFIVSHLSQLSGEVEHPVATIRI
jgi:hypothetical protein